jgi:C-terminal processing protease CtpA/Prc
MTRKRSNSLYHSLTLFAIVVLPVLVSSCLRDDDPSPVAVNANNKHVNDWILENMELWYLWQNELPTSPDKTDAPDDFFRSLLSTGDRFSWIQDNYVDLLNSLRGITKESGYEYVLYREDGTQNVIAQVLYVKPGSPVESAGLKRGDVITHINGKRPTTDNYQVVLADLSADSYTLVFKPIVIGEARFDDERSVTLSTVVYAEDPNHLSKVIEVNDKKIGYYVYNFFASGTEQNAQLYDLEMDQVFAGFKASGITDLVLDLRFNSGGSETSATNLASLIAPGANNGKVFFKKQYNDQVQQAILADPNGGLSFLQRTMTAKSANIGNELSGRVYILTGSRTASASELVINGLMPYMDVFLIGNVTYGKNVGSISIYDKDDPKNTWGMQPIVMKAYNSRDESGYGDGFVPNIENKDNSLFIYPLGDTREALLAEAIAQITGVPILARKADAISTRKDIGYSLDHKKMSFVLNVEPLK